MIYSELPYLPKWSFPTPAPGAGLDPVHRGSCTGSISTVKDEPTLFGQDLARIP